MLKEIFFKAGQNRTLKVDGAENRSISGVSSSLAKGGFQINTPRKFSVDANSTLLNSASTLTLSVGAAKITLRSDGTATVHADRIALKGKQAIDLESGGTINLNARGEIKLSGKRIDLN